MISSTVSVNINPFLRFDGYWALCDFLNVTNLRENSNKLLKQFFRKCIGKTNTLRVNALNIFLIFYSLSTFLFIGYFFIMMIFFEQNSIIYFPVNLYNFFYEIFTNISHVTFDRIKSALTEFVLPFIFYLFLYRIIIKPFFIYFFKKINHDK